MVLFDLNVRLLEDFSKMSIFEGESTHVLPVEPTMLVYPSQEVGLLIVVYHH